jgi:hypothetical protein
MGKYIYYSILIFSAFIFFLYIYLIFQKIASIYEVKKTIKYKEELGAFVDDLFINMEENYPSRATIKKIKVEIKNSLKRRIIIDRITYFNSTFKGDIRKNIKKFCEDINLVKYILADLKTKDKLKITLNCKILGELRSERSLPYLLDLLDIDSIDIKYNALMAISKIGQVEAFVESFTKLKYNIPLSERSLIEIVDSFEGDKVLLYKKMLGIENVYISTIFIKSAGNYMDTRFNQYISQFIKADDKNKKIAAIKAIGQTVDIRFLKDLINCLKDEHWEVRAAAAKSLGKMGDTRALSYLVEALSDREWWVRYNSAEAIFKTHEGIEKVETVFMGEDNFAKDSVLAAMETCGVFGDLYLYEHSSDPNKRQLANLINEYIIKLEIQNK